jgi:hypothetical protein
VRPAKNDYQRRTFVNQEIFMSHALRKQAVAFATTAALALFAAAALAQTPAAGASSTGKTMTPQQQRMATCNKEATGKSGDDRKTFMSSCLKGESAAPQASSPQQRMKDCNARASAQALSGDKRKSFMSDCLKTKS